MWLETIRTWRFGNLGDLHRNFREGLNIVFGPNESGKSTLHHAILIALGTTPSQAKKHERWRAWGSDSWYKIQLDFRDEESARWRITKDFESAVCELSPPDPEAKVFTDRHLIETHLERLLGTSSHVVMKSTLCVSEDALKDITDETTDSSRKQISESLEAVVTGSDDNLNTEKALSKLGKTIAEMSKGLNRHAKYPGEIARLRKQLSEFDEKIRELESRVTESGQWQRKLEQVNTRLDELEKKLPPLETTIRNYDRHTQLVTDLERAEKEERDLEMRIERVNNAQQNIAELEQKLKQLGPVSDLNDDGRIEIDGTAKQLDILLRGKEIYDNEIAEYDEALTAFQLKKAEYDKEFEAYRKAKLLFDAEWQKYEKDAQNYDETIRRHKREQDEYDRLMNPYREKLRLREMAQEQWAAEHEEYIVRQQKYDAQKTEHEKRVVKYIEESRLKSQQSQQARSRLQVYMWLGLIVFTSGLLTLLVADQLLVGLVLMVAGGAWGLRSYQHHNRITAQDSIAHTQKPEFQLEPPELPNRPDILSAEITRPDVEEPAAVQLERPMQPSTKQPEPPEKLGPPPTKPEFDEVRLQNVRDKFAVLLAEVECSSIEELNRDFDAARELRLEKQKHETAIIRALGDDSVEELKERRQNASRERRDFTEILSEPEMKAVSEMSPVDRTEIDSKRGGYVTEQKDLLRNKTLLEIKIEDSADLRDELYVLQEQEHNTRMQLKRAEERLAVYELTLSCLEEARDITLENVQKRLNPSTSKYMSAFTLGRYDNIKVNTDLSIEVQDPTDPENVVDPGLLSRGTRDQLYMSARLALVDMLFPKTMPPILLDDPFVHFDPDRLSAAIEMLQTIAEERQVILFTCSDRYQNVGHHVRLG